MHLRWLFKQEDPRQSRWINERKELLSASRDYLNAIRASFVAQCNRIRIELDQLFYGNHPPDTSDNSSLGQKFESYALKVHNDIMTKLDEALMGSNRTVATRTTYVEPGLPIGSLAHIINIGNGPQASLANIVPLIARSSQPLSREVLLNAIQFELDTNTTKVEMWTRLFGLNLRAVFPELRWPLYPQNVLGRPQPRRRPSGAPSEERPPASTDSMQQTEAMSPSMSATTSQTPPETSKTKKKKKQKKQKKKKPTMARSPQSDSIS